METKRKQIKNKYRIYDLVDKKYISIGKKSTWLIFPIKAIKSEIRYKTSLGKDLFEYPKRFEIHEFEPVFKEKYDADKNVIVNFENAR